MVNDAGRRLVWCVDDPALLTGGDMDRLTGYRRVRDTLVALIDGELLTGGRA